MSKKIFLILIILVLFIPSIIHAGTYQCKDQEGNPGYAYYDGLVPCGREVCVGESKERADQLATTSWKIRRDMAEKNMSFANACEDYGGKAVFVGCTGCHLLIMADGIIDYVLIYIIPPVALLMILIAGVMYYLSGGKPDLRNKANKALKYTALGLFLIYGSFIIVNLIF